MKDLRSEFEQRKADHIRISLDDSSQTLGQSGLDSLELVHESFPEMNFEEVSTEASFFSHKLSAPFFISSMTAGHHEGQRINFALAALSERKQILMGVGSQRKELFDKSAANEWVAIRKQHPNALLLGNIGLSQLIQAPTEKILELVESLQAIGLFVHVNSLQEVLQPEGTPFFKGGLKALSSLCSSLKLPVIVKEVGCGFSLNSLKRLQDTGIYAVDLAGKGGTHWGRVETLRSPKEHLLYAVGQNFSNWGVSLLDSLLNAKKLELSYKVWASGGVRSGLDIAKCISMGAEMVGLAQPFLKAVVDSTGESKLKNSANEEDRLNLIYDQLLYELKVAMFCTASQNLDHLKREGKCYVSDKKS